MGLCLFHLAAQTPGLGFALSRIESADGSCQSAVAWIGQDREYDSDTVTHPTIDSYHEQTSILLPLFFAYHSAGTFCMMHLLVVVEVVLCCPLVQVYHADVPYSIGHFT